MDANLPLRLDRVSKTPLYLQLRDQLRELILAGKLDDGLRLPPERRLADALGVNRTTVVNAYRELQADALLDSHVGRGTIVRHPRRTPSDESTAWTSLSWGHYLAGRTQHVHDPLLAEAHRLSSRGDVISFVGAGPDPSLYPVEAYRQIIDYLLTTNGRAVLQHCPVEGHYPLREAIARLMTEAGTPMAPQNTLVIGGSQEGLYLIAQAMLEPGDTVAVENPTYLGALQVFRAMGVRLLGIPLDDDGLRVDLLEAALRRNRPRLIYTLPTYHNPTGRSLSLARRHQLLEIAGRHQIPIVEDDPAGWLRYRDPALPSLKSLDSGEQVVYLSTFSEMLFPGLRLGWLAGPAPVLQAVGAAKRLADPASNSLAQWSIAELCRQGLLEAHIRSINLGFSGRLTRVLAALRQSAPAGMTWVEPAGGLFVWCRLPAGLRSRDLLADAANHRVAFLPGEVFHVDGGGAGEIRLNFTSCPEQVIAEGVTRLCAAVGRLARDRPRREETGALSERPIV